MNVQLGAVCFQLATGSNIQVSNAPNTWERPYLILVAVQKFVHQ